MVKELFINGIKRNYKPPEKIRIKPNNLLIEECENEVKYIEDLLRITEMINGYKSIEGENEKQYYLIHAKDGQTKSSYQNPRYFTKNEFSQIVEIAAKMTNEPPPETIETQIKVKPLLQWNVSVNSLYTLFFDLLNDKIITWNGKTNEGEKMEIARMLTSYFVDKDGNNLSIETIKQALKPTAKLARKRIDVSPISLPLTKSKKILKK
jgi:hypothetical protein